jgi:dTDP-4-amino-4,6-dideoxygalactose transaminase
MGFNFRFTDLQASIAIAQLERVEQRSSHIKAVYSIYEKELKQFSFLKLIPVAVSSGEIPIYVEVLCRERERLVTFLASKNIQVRPFYPDLNSALHLNAAGDFPHSRVFGECGLVLPCGPSQPLENIDRVIESLRQFEKGS